jgi:hypothetical protein
MTSRWVRLPQVPTVLVAEHVALDPAKSDSVGT